MDKNSNTIIIYTDGSCLGNPGPGGWAAILHYKNKKKVISGGYKLTTNNRMEMKAVIEALKAISNNKRYNIEIFTDSSLVYNSIEKGWLYGWIKKNWRKSDRSEVLNIDLWKEMLPLLKLHDIKFNWVKGHSGIPENEECDKYCKEEASKTNLPDDVEYLRMI